MVREGERKKESEREEERKKEREGEKEKTGIESVFIMQNGRHISRSCLRDSVKL